MSEDTKTETDFPEAWRPEAGQKLKGEVVGVTATDAGYGPYPIVTLQTEGGLRSVHAFHTVLRSELAKCRPGRGDELEIVYLGKKESTSSATGSYHSYRVRGGKEQEYDWNQDLPEDQRTSSTVPIEPSYANVGASAAPLSAQRPAGTPTEAVVDPDPDDADLPF